MSYTFDSTLTQYINCSSSLTLYPSTFSAWVYMTSRSATNTNILSLGQSGTTSQGRITVANSGSNYAPFINANQPAVANVTATATTGTNLNTWHHVCGVFESSTSRIIYLDGGNSATNTVSSVPPGLNSIRIGASFGAAGAPAILFNGRISDTAIWSVVLTIDEITSLSKGFSPKKIRPQSLEFHCPLIRDLNEQISSSALTNNSGVTVSDNQRTYL